MQLHCCTFSHIFWNVLLWCDTGPHTFSFPWQYRLSSAGKGLPGTSTRLRNVDSNGCGEVSLLPPVTPYLCHSLQVVPIVSATSQKFYMNFCTHFFSRTDVYLQMLSFISLHKNLTKLCVIKTTSWFIVFLRIVRQFHHFFHCCDHRWFVHKSLEIFFTSVIRKTQH